jgi:pimeloyl-ACP methyl ester carboxylesterase
MVEQRRWVKVGGHELYLDCLGSGSPTVVLDGEFVETWTTVQSAVGGFTRVCSFDQSALELGESGPFPITLGQIDKEVHVLLRNAHVPAPYVLVGFGFGGSIMQLYASRYSRETGGLVLVDAFPETFLSRPGMVRDTGLDLGRSRKELRAARWPKTLPLMVLSHGIYLSFPRDVERVWLAQQRKLTWISTNSVQVIARHSTHAIPELQPTLVSEAILEVMVAARSRTHRLQPCGFWIEARGGACAGR